jgi:FkbM family methyltransferase
MSLVDLFGPPAIFPSERETALVAEYFSSVPRGYFVEVGANDPVALSQTWHLEQQGWTGVLIEPQPALAQRLRESRKAKVYECACSAPSDSGTRLTLNLSEPSTIHASLNPDHFVAGTDFVGVIEVVVLTLDEILSEAGAPQPIDFVSIDVEGHELQALAGFDLSRWQPRLLLIEDLAMNTRIHRALLARGYRWIRRTGINAWYVPAGEPHRASLRGRWQFLRKYYAGTPFYRLRESRRKLRQRWRKRLRRPQPP